MLATIRKNRKALEDMVKFLDNSMAALCVLSFPPCLSPQDIVELEEILRRAKEVIDSMKKRRFSYEAI